MLHKMSVAILVTLTVIIWGSSSVFAQEPAPKPVETGNVFIDSDMDRELAVHQLAEVLRQKDEAEKARKEREKAGDKDKFVRDAREILKKGEKDRQKGEKRESDAKASILLRGCDPDSVEVNSNVGTTWGLKPSGGNDTVYVEIFNLSSQTVNIRSTVHGDLITGLCSGGYLKLTFASLDSGPEQVEILLTAVAQSAGAGLQTESFGFTLERTDRFRDRQVFSRKWKLEPRR